ncbi:unnamed protein product [Aphanomyces euteiches]|uniref:Uncharacterized protein n=1 Tax=Aphanomyces euteiches TaxID=100861 RepID=A0A6G0XMP8_9STRA|nr:hypothetical protein Ae201684_003252 [Aphanomyces euteiches]KAH9098714.1 hypothetical protein Ae201684P_017925 [Aphanomyces euteiches]KAH9131604.1 hypothetical protein AeRB84_021766 [Aphanomyces euteiches]
MSPSKVITKIVLINVVLPLIIYNIASKHTSQVVALVLSGIPPAADTLNTMVKDRRIDMLSSLTVVSIALSAFIATLTHDPKLLLVKDSLFTLIIGATFWLSTVCGKENLIWTYNRQFRGPDAKAELDAAYAKPDVRSRSNFICRVWGSGLLLEATIRVALVYMISVDAMAYMSPILMVAAFGCLGLWTKWYVGKIQRQAAEHAKEEVTLPNPSYSKSSSSVV